MAKHNKFNYQHVYNPPETVEEPAPAVASHEDVENTKPDIAYIDCPGFKGVRLRSGTSTDADILTVLPENTNVIVLERGTTWTKIRYAHQEGYVQSRFLANM